MNSKRASVLIICLGVLTVLAILAVSFARFMEMEKKASTNYRFKQQARMNAESGIEHFLSEFRRQRIEAFSEPWNATTGLWSFKDNYNRYLGNGVASVESASNPSYAQTITGRRVSGTVGNAYNLYTLKVIESASKLNLNLRTAQLKITLKYLGEAIASYHQTYNRQFGTKIGIDARKRALNPLTDTLIDKILKRRKSLPGDKFTHINQVKEVIGDTNFAVANDYITVHGWLNDKVIKPLIRASVGGAKRNDTAITDLEPRHPVNVNTAPIPVLVACLRDLTSYHREDWPLTPVLGAATIGLRKGPFPRGGMTNPVSSASAERLARDIASRRRVGPFRTWDEFYIYIRSRTYLQSSQRETILSNANPNSMFNTFQPDQVRWSPVQKSDLIYYTTEFSFASMGYYEIESLGRVLDSEPPNEILGQSLVSTVVKVFEVLHHTTQRDFLQYLTSSRETITYPESIYNVLKSIHKSSAYAGAGDFVARNGSPLDGYIAMHTEGVEFSRSGPTSPLTWSWNRPREAGLTFLAPFIDSFYPIYSGWRWYSSTRKYFGRTVFQEEALHPDGMVSSQYNSEYPHTAPNQRSAHEALNFQTFRNINPLRGTIGFWVKLDNPRIGSHETLFYTTQFIQRTGNPRTGVTWKLERYGNKIKSTRFYWFEPKQTTLIAVPSTIRYLWTEKVFTINWWQPREWHYIVHSWDNYTEQRLFFDGYMASSGLSLDNSTTRRDRFHLRSTRPIEYMTPGSSIFFNPQTETVYNGATFNQGYIYRPLNGKIDDIKAWSFYLGSSFDYRRWLGIPTRFTPNPRTPPEHKGYFLAPADGEVVAATYTVLYPARWGAWSFTGFFRSRLTQVSASFSTPSGGGKISASGFQTFSPKKVTKGEKIYYTFTFTPPILAMSGSYNLTPVVDDITMFVLRPSPEIDSYTTVY